MGLLAQRGKPGTESESFTTTGRHAHSHASGSCLCLPQHSPLLAAAAALHVADQELDVAGAAAIVIY
jgi:hypothetical protein